MDADIPDLEGSHGLPAVREALQIDHHAGLRLEDQDQGDQIADVIAEIPGGLVASGDRRPLLRSVDLLGQRPDHEG